MLFSAISIGEITIVVILAFVVLGPDKLPDAARELGKFVKQARTIMRDLNDEINQEMGQIKKDTGFDETAKDIREAIGETNRTRKIIQDAYRDPVKTGIKEIKQIEFDKPSTAIKKEEKKQPQEKTTSVKKEAPFAEKHFSANEASLEKEWETVVVEELPPPKEETDDNQ